MEYSEKLVHGRLIRRYIRFLADVELDSGERVVAHCTNSGSMKSCLEPGAEVYLSPVSDPSRKTRFTWEMIRINNGWVGINTSIPNRLAHEWMSNNTVPGLIGYDCIRREVTFGESRLDIFASNSHENCVIEVKNVTLKEGALALFPDAVTVRGQKHLNTLIEQRQKGFRAVMLYIVQRNDVSAFAPASEIDPCYAAMFYKARENGVEMIVAQAKVTPVSIKFHQLLPVI